MPFLFELWFQQIRLSGFCSWMWSFIQWMILVLHLWASIVLGPGEWVKIHDYNVIIYIVWQKMRIQCIRNIMKKHLFQPFSQGYLPGGSNPFVAHLKVETANEEGEETEGRMCLKSQWRRRDPARELTFVEITWSPAFALRWGRKWDIRKGERCWLWWME